MARRRDEQGAALAEFAICLPFLTMIVLGTLDLGRAFLLAQQAKNAAREGAAFLARYPGNQKLDAACPDPDNAHWHVNNESARAFSIKVNGGDAVCDTTPTAAERLTPGHPISVTATTPFTTLTPFGRQILGSNPTISGTVCVNILGAAPNGDTCT